MSPHLIALLLLLAPAPQNVTLPAATYDFPLTLTPQATTPAVTQSDCSALCPMIWGLAAVAEDEPYEVAADAPQIEVGAACRCLSGPGPKLRLDGSEN